MSTFDGIICEIPGIAVDSFRYHNLNSKVLFLSHCHTDHMVGLASLANVDNFSGLLYASPVSVLFLKHHYPSLIPYLKEVNVGCATFIQIPEMPQKQLAERTLTVTLLPAGHCPGSVMFLFEIDDIKILYTGDFRLPKGAIKKMKALHYSSGEPKTFTNLYLDTTFMKSIYPYFPSQFESFEELYRIAREWITLSKKRVILLHIPAKYGSEYIYIELAKRLKMPIHVTKEAYDKYVCIPNMDKSVTLHPNITQIHACLPNNRNTEMNCCYIDKENIRIIKPSALIWTNMKENVDLSKYDEKLNIYRVCYSSHASFNELKYFIEYFKQKKVTACVLPEGSVNEINKHISKICSEFDSVIKYAEDDSDSNLNSILFAPDLSEDIKHLQSSIKRNRKTYCLNNKIVLQRNNKKFKDEFSELSD